MTVKLKTLVDGANSLQMLAATKLKTTKSFQIATFLRKSNEALKTFEEQRIALLEEFSGGEKDTTTNQYKLEGENKKQFLASYNELLDTDLPDLIPPQVTLEDFRSNEKFAPAALAPLLNFIINVDPVAEENLVTISAPRGEVVMMLNGMSALGSNAFDKETAPIILHTLNALVTKVRELKEEEDALVGTDEEVTELLKEMYKNEVEVRLPQIPLSILEGLDVEPSVYMNLERIIKE